MMDKKEFDAVVVGSGPNGLAAAITLAIAGCKVAVFEASKVIGGGSRSAELTLPGFVHDICSAIHPLAISSPFFRKLPLSDHGLTWVHPSASLAHPYDDGTAALLEASLKETCDSLGEDGEAYKKLIEPIARDWDLLADTFLGPPKIPRHFFAALKFGIKGIRPAESLAKSYFKSEKARAFFAGLAAHSILPLDRLITSAVGLVLATLSHVRGWPFPQGGSQKIADSLAGCLESLDGKIYTGISVASVDELPSARAILLDVTPRQVLEMAGHCLPDNYNKQLRRYRYGPGVFKIDWALNSKIPWKAKECLRAGTLHLGGSLQEIALSEKVVWEGRHAEKPYVLLAQQSLFDPSRAPEGKQAVWAYCHVPHGSEKDMTEEIENQVERFAPGFKEIILARHAIRASEFAAYNANYIGGDIIGGVQDIWQLFTRPVCRIVPYSTPNPSLFLCSSSTPPGGGVHGMCGYHAAREVLKRVFKFNLPEDFTFPPNRAPKSIRGE